MRRHPKDLGLQPDGRIAFWTSTSAYALAMLASTVPLVHSVAYLIVRGYDAALAAGIVEMVVSPACRAASSSTC